MANQRKLGKKKLGFWFTEGEIEVLKFIGKVEGLNMVDTLRHVLAKHHKRLMRQLKKSNKDKKGNTK